MYMYSGKKKMQNGGWQRLNNLKCPRYGKPLANVSELESDVCNADGRYCLECLEHEEEADESSIDY